MVWRQAFGGKDPFAWKGVSEATYTDGYPKFPQLTTSFRERLNQ